MIQFNLLTARRGWGRSAAGCDAGRRQRLRDDLDGASNVVETGVEIVQTRLYIGQTFGQAYDLTLRGHVELTQYLGHELGDNLVRRSRHGEVAIQGTRRSFQGGTRIGEVRHGPGPAFDVDTTGGA